LAEAIPFATSHRQLIANGIASAKQRRNDRMAHRANTGFAATPVLC
jgi:hypothetical protein